MSDALLAPFLDSPGSSGIFLDFDGTLSEIVHVPHEARPADGVQELLDALARRFKVVAIVSGRSAQQLVEWLGPDVEIWGTHGAERARGGIVEIVDRVLPHAELMQRVKEEAEERMAAMGLPGIHLEDKTVMLGLHFRAAEDVGEAEKQLSALADDLVAKHGLIRAGGRLAFELRPPVELSKAAVVLQRAREESLGAAAFAGDDRVDLPGYDALDVLEEEGTHTLRLAVDSTEAPAELLERADVVVNGPRGAVDFLQRLLTD
jgi:trehalose 6-phosphate phosphatase